LAYNTIKNITSLHIITSWIVCYYSNIFFVCYLIFLLEVTLFELLVLNRILLNIYLSDEAIANKIMPKLNYEIEDFKYNTWHITNWQHLRKRTTGPKFEAGNWKWCLVILIIFRQMMYNKLV
jgi:hypothetical protein